MSPHELAIRLVGLRQHALPRTPDGKRFQAAYRDELRITTAEQPGVLEAIINLLATEIAIDRNSRALPTPEALPSPPRGAPVELTIDGDPRPEEIALVDLLAADLAGFPGWVVTVVLDGGSIVARPAATS